SLANQDFNNLPSFYQSFDNVVEFAFPTVQPSYYTGGDAVGWAPASAAVQAAFRTVFADLAQIVNVSFVETSNIDDFNVIVISQNDQQNQGLAGYAYFPNESFFIGSDILLSNIADAPAITAGLSNSDYELVLHELGHALGLKHPFDADGASTTILNVAEDFSAWTVMTYNLQPGAFDGAFRAFDLMTFAEIFGVRASYRGGDDSYEFSTSSGVFVIDGGGIDMVTAQGQSAGAYIDLRPGMHSYLGSKTALISAPLQLTISGGSAIENATGGSGNDLIIGNGLANELRGGQGHDRIFGGDGADIIYGDAGNDVIDLSEVVASRDVIVIESLSTQNGQDTIYAFQQGTSGDTVSFAPMLGKSLLDVVVEGFVPLANIGNTIARLVGEGLSTATELDVALSAGGLLEKLTLAPGTQSLIVSAATQATGQDQHLFHVQNVDDDLVVQKVAMFTGNYLDIDSWHANNFV
uniref:M10 family metallopeptidase C-terminal domain-containing protein n=1 Tax=Roseicyclus sp. TaxID=1914329 RepID=UPI003F6CB9B9